MKHAKILRVGFGNFTKRVVYCIPKIKIFFCKNFIFIAYLQNNQKNKPLPAFSSFRVDSTRFIQPYYGVGFRVQRDLFLLKETKMERYAKKKGGRTRK